MIVVFAALATLVAIVLLFGFLVWLALQGAPYVRSRPESISRMIALAVVRPGDRACDLGSGNGEVLIALAKAGAEAHGYELSPLLVRLARKRIREAGLAERAFIHWKNFWRVDLGGYDVITVFGIPHIMGRLERKLRSELKPGTRVVSNAFRFPAWPSAGAGEGIYLYRR